MRPPAQVSQALTGRLPCAPAMGHVDVAHGRHPRADRAARDREHRLHARPAPGLSWRCGDVPALGACTTQSCRQLARQLANFCSVPLNAVTFARRPRAPAGFVPVSGTVSRKFKPSRRGQVRVKLKLNKLGRALLARSTALPLETRAEVRERKGTTLSALFQTPLRLR